MGFVADFKEFINRGNVVDLAVAVVLGAAFGKIVTTFVSSVVTPPIGLIMGGKDFSDMKYVLQEAVMKGAEVVQPEIAIGYGSFIQAIIDFLLISLAVFIAVRMYMSMQKAEEEEAGPTSEELLGEIRDLLKNRP